jgi:hypothetical protein
MLVAPRRLIASFFFFRRFCLKTKLAANAAAPYNTIGSITVLTIHAQPRKQQQQLYLKAKNRVDCVQKLLCSEHRVTR